VLQECLQELINRSKHLKVTVDGLERLESILNDVNRWEDRAHSLLERSKALLSMHDSDTIIDSIFSAKIEELLNKTDSAIESAQSLVLQLNELPKLHHASLILRWSLKALSLCSRVPPYEVIILSLLEQIFGHHDLLSHNKICS